ncbi:uncharacterized protein APUU_21606S [Aspergillus puulaauensis]|uniref:Ankyrin repeat-containing domain protein n=1 Tax=Aspergillus puulaauensis TaxID=1220207 RepID=A0A7R8AIX1_9EURO|nr:uncharacterized protein APUU_21606S [Aspergillus puulaauensis]BCS21174.1 hypothetical protein APUU_21606S [Aspergillus puulaauensis]
MGFEDLPTELILQIAESAPTPRTLRTMALLNRRCYKIIARHLVEFNIKYHKGVGLVHAAKKGNLRAVELFLDAGADPNTAPVYTTKNVDFCLWGVSYIYGSLDVLDLPLFLAVKNKHKMTALYLLQRGANPDIRSWKGNPHVADLAEFAGDYVLATLLRVLRDSKAEVDIDWREYRYRRTGFPPVPLT